MPLMHWEPVGLTLADDVVNDLSQVPFLRTYPSPRVVVLLTSVLRHYISYFPHYYNKILDLPLPKKKDSQSSDSQPVGPNPFNKPLSPKIFTLQFIAVAKLQF